MPVRWANVLIVTPLAADLDSDMTSPGGHCEIGVFHLNGDKRE